MAGLSIFSPNFKALLNNGINFFKLESNENKGLENISEKKSEIVNNSLNILTCSNCNVEFQDAIEQRMHYKSDWHRHNIKQIARSKDPLTLEQFNEQLEKSLVSSGSSSSESDDFDPQDEVLTTQGKCFLKTSTGVVISVYQSLILHKKESFNEINVTERLNKYNEKTLSACFMLGGGRFSGAIFQGTEPIKHKTFHCYTVRAGQGGSQSACDNRLGSHPKSAGSSLRRYNEQALKQHVEDIIGQWTDDIEKCDVIFYKASGPYNQSVLFGGKKPILDRMDAKVRGIPLSTKKATFSELKRVFRLLTTVTTHESEQVTLEWIFNQKLRIAEMATKKKQKLSKKLDRSKSREHVDRPNPCSSSSSESSSEDDDVVELKSSDQNVTFEETLQEYGDSLTPEERQQHQKASKKRPKISKKARLKEREEREKRELVDLVIEGKLDTLKKIIDDEDGGEKKVDVLKMVLDEENNGLLHVAAKHEKHEVVKFLLVNGADPCVKNTKQQTPYACTQNKSVRDVFKEFAKENPDMYNYNKANIPIVKEVTEEDEERRRVQRKMKRDKKKAKEQENKVKAEEEAEKQRFLNLSDREKMALAAERRILNKGGAVVVRCFLCAADITGKVPFEYSGNLFCSTDCLKAHRYKNPSSLS